MSVLWHRLGAMSGILASILIITGTIIGDMISLVSVAASFTSIARTFVENRTFILVGTYLMLIGAFFLICFLAYLRAFLLEATDEKNWLVSVAFGGGLVTCAIPLLAGHFSQGFTVLGG